MVGGSWFQVEGAWCEKEHWSLVCKRMVELGVKKNAVRRFGCRKMGFQKITYQKKIEHVNSYALYFVLGLSSMT